MTSYLSENEAENLQNGDVHLAQIPDFEIEYLENHLAHWGRWGLVFFIFYVLFLIEFDFFSTGGSLYSMFILVMCILLQRISNPSDFVKYIGGKISLWRLKDIIAQKLLLRGKLKKVPSRAHVCSLDQKARNPHD